MKNKKLFFVVLTILLIALITTIVLICVKKPEDNSPPSLPPATDGSSGNNNNPTPNPNPPQMQSYIQNLNYNESIKTILNPDQGFYRPIYVKLTESEISYNKNIVTNSTQLYHLRIDISAFSGKTNKQSDKLLTTEALNGLKEILTFLKQKQKSAIVRFAYDPGYSGKSNLEPETNIIIEHIKQVCSVLNNYPLTITAIEAGLIGPWGEMHTSAIANAATINPIIDTFLNNTTNIPILARTPKMIYNYLGITLNDIENYTIENTSKAYRLGLYNDGYLGSSNDLGTYTNRAKEVEFLSKQTNHLPYGGEVVIPSSELHNIDVCLPEMEKLNLSYLNVEWNYEVIDKWKSTYYTSEIGNNQPYYNQTAFTYIQNHMGYRFVLTNSVFEYSSAFDRLNIKLTLNNVGFGNLNKSKLAKLIFVNENNEVKYVKQVDAFNGETNINYSTNLNLENGNYKVYLSLYGEEVNNNLTYALQFANENLWNSELNANLIGEININK